MELAKMVTKSDLEKALNQFRGVNYKDVIVGEDQIQLQEDGLLSVKNKVFHLSNEGGRQLMNLCGIPITYVKKCPNNLLCQNLNYWFSGGLPNKKVRFITNEEDDTILGITDNKASIIQNERLLEIGERILGPDNIRGFHRVHISLDFSSFAFIGTKSITPKEDDILYGGIAVQNSLLNLNPLEISAYVFRQWCSNGAISCDSIARWSRNQEVSEFNSWAERTFHLAWESIDEEFHRIETLVNTKVNGNAHQLLLSIARKHDLPSRIYTKLQEQLLDAERRNEKIETMFDLYNLITEYASHTNSLSFRSATDLQKIGGRLAKDVHLCPACHQIIN